MKFKYYSLLLLMFLISACFHNKQLENKHNCSYKTFNEETYNIGDKIIMPEIRLGTYRPASIMESHINDSLLIIVDFLKKHQELVVEIRSHTDFRCTDSLNLILAQRRANKYMDFLLTKSINPNRITAIGIGESEPFIIDDCTKDLYLNPFEPGDTMSEKFIKGLKISKDRETAHKINRRSEIVIIGKSKIGIELINNAYEKDSVEMLNEFFRQWMYRLPTTYKSDLLALSEIQKETHNVFTAFYEPLNLYKLGGSEWGNDIYKDVKYLVVQNSIYIYRTDKVHYSQLEYDSIIYKRLFDTYKGDTSKINKLNYKVDGKYSEFIRSSFGEINTEIQLIDSIPDFRPKLKYENIRPLYLSKEYSLILNNFLKNEYKALGDKSIMSPAESKGESEKRKVFLENYIKIWYGHWGGYWQLYSYPFVSSIIFDNEMKYAKVKYRLVYEGGEAVMENINGEWKIISAERTWIE